MKEEVREKDKGGRKEEGGGGRGEGEKENK